MFRPLLTEARHRGIPGGVVGASQLVEVGEPVPVLSHLPYRDDISDVTITHATAPSGRRELEVIIRVIYVHDLVSPQIETFTLQNATKLYSLVTPYR